jgi:hypothetical protein
MLARFFAGREKARLIDSSRGRPESMPMSLGKQSVARLNWIALRDLRRSPTSSAKTFCERIPSITRISRCLHCRRIPRRRRAEAVSGGALNSCRRRVRSASEGSALRILTTEASLSGVGRKIYRKRLS